MKCSYLINTEGVKNMRCQFYWVISEFLINKMFLLNQLLLSNQIKHPQESVPNTFLCPWPKRSSGGGGHLVIWSSVCFSVRPSVRPSVILSCLQLKCDILKKVWVMIQSPNLDCKFIFGFLTLFWHPIPLGLGGCHILPLLPLGASVFHKLMSSCFPWLAQKASLKITSGCWKRNISDITACGIDLKKRHV